MEASGRVGACPWSLAVASGPWLCWRSLAPGEEAGASPSPVLSSLRVAWGAISRGQRRGFPRAQRRLPALAQGLLPVQLVPEPLLLNPRGRVSRDVSGQKGQPYCGAGAGASARLSVLL